MKVFIFPHYCIILHCHNLFIHSVQLVFIVSKFWLQYCCCEHSFCEHMHAYLLSKHFGMKFLGHRARLFKVSVDVKWFPKMIA